MIPANSLTDFARRRSRPKAALIHRQGSRLNE